MVCILSIFNTIKFGFYYHSFQLSEIFWKKKKIVYDLQIFQDQFLLGSYLLAKFQVSIK